MVLLGDDREKKPTNGRVDGERRRRTLDESDVDRSTTAFEEALTCISGRCLKVLEIPMSGITDDMVSKHIEPLPNLAILDINHCLKITAKGIATFGTQCKSLIHLKRNMLPLEDSSPIDDSEPKTIAGTMPKLQNLELCFGKFGDTGLSEILIKCKSLTHLDIQGGWNVELEGELEGICEKLECFQNPWSGFSDEFPESESEGDDSEELESE